MAYFINPHHFVISGVRYAHASTWGFILFLISESLIHFDSRQKSLSGKVQ